MTGVLLNLRPATDSETKMFISANGHFIARSQMKIWVLLEFTQVTMLNLSNIYLDMPQSDNHRRKLKDQTNLL